LCKKIIGDFRARGCGNGILRLLLSAGLTGRKCLL